MTEGMASDEAIDGEFSSRDVAQLVERLSEEQEVAGSMPAVSAIRSRCICGKARYATEKEAGRAVKRMKARGRDRSYEGLLHPYMCPERKGIWHVGHTDE